MANVKLLTPKILKWEGGYVNDPLDRGGATNKGVTLATWMNVGHDKDGDGDIDKEDIKLLTEEDATVVLKKYYWDKWHADDIKSQGIAEILVDWVWGSGIWGIKKPQQLLGLKSDGMVGPNTLKAVNNYPNQEELFNKIKQIRIDFIDDIINRSIKTYIDQIKRTPTKEELLEHTQKRFEKGWKNRINDYKFY